MTSKSSKFEEYLSDCGLHTVTPTEQAFAVSAEPGGLYVTGHTMEEVEEQVFLHALTHDYSARARMAILEQEVCSAIRRELMPKSPTGALVRCSHAVEAVAHMVVNSFFERAQEYAPVTGGDWLFSPDRMTEAERIYNALESTAVRDVLGRIVSRLGDEALRVMESRSEVFRAMGSPELGVDACRLCQKHLGGQLCTARGYDYGDSE